MRKPPGAPMARHGELAAAKTGRSAPAGSAGRCRTLRRIGSAGQEPSPATGRLRAARRCRHHPSRAPGARSQRRTRPGSNVPCGERRCTKTIGPSSTKTSASPSPFTSPVASQSPSAPALRTKSARPRLRDHTGIAGNPARGAGQAACAPAPSSIDLRPHRPACCATSIAAAVAGATLFPLSARGAGPTDEGDESWSVRSLTLAG